MTSACGGSFAAQQPASTVTVTVTAKAKKKTVKPTPKPVKTPAATPAATPAPVEEKKALPNVVGMNLQAAQDTMQAAGFFILNDKDATGQNRFQINDRAWVVTRQTPAAGRLADLSTLVTLFAKKIGE